MSSLPREQIVDHLPALRAFAISLTHNAASADDLVQDTILKAWSKIDQFEDGTNLKAWLFTILRNTFYSGKRKARREVADINNALAYAMAERPAHDGRLQLKDFRAAFATLPPEQREVLTLVGAAGFSYEDAAMMTGVAVGTVKSRANRARKRLAELMNLDPDGPLEMTDKATMAVVSGNRGGAF